MNNNKIKDFLQIYQDLYKIIKTNDFNKFVKYILYNIDNLDNKEILQIINSKDIKEYYDIINKLKINYNLKKINNDIIIFINNLYNIILSLNNIINEYNSEILYLNDKNYIKYNNEYNIIINNIINNLDLLIKINIILKYNNYFENKYNEEKEKYLIIFLNKNNLIDKMEKDIYYNYTIQQILNKIIYK